MRFALLLILSLISHSAMAVGFTHPVIGGDTPITVGIWYPSDAAVPGQPNTPFRQALALDAPLKGDKHPLVVISHGYGGWMGGHADLALALARRGYIVVAPTHPGNNKDDISATPSQWLASRPADIHRVIDYMLATWRGALRIDPSRIGVYGFSAGGYTALVAAGGVPNLKLALHDCAEDPAQFVCHEGILAGVVPAQLQPKLAAVAGDRRIGAISVAAPGLAFAFDTAGLAGIKVPVQIWSGMSDKRVPDSSNGTPLASRLGKHAELHRVKKAGHFAFMVPCNPRLKAIKPKIWEMVCVDAAGFDRAAFHDELNQQVVAFFDRSLPGHRSGEN